MMRWIRDTLLYAYLLGFFEHIGSRSECGMTHETNEDWTDAYDAGWNKAEDIRLFLCLDEAETYAMVWAAPLMPSDVFWITSAVSEAQAVRRGIDRMGRAPELVFVEGSIQDTFHYLKAMGFRP